MEALILVVEDENQLRELLAEHLNSEGFKVITAANGQEALRLWREQRPDLIVLDLMIPLLSGMEVLKIVRQQNSTPVVILTARSDEVDKLLGLELGADDYMTKPFSPRELSARVRAVLRRSLNRDDNHQITLGNLDIVTERHEALLDGQLLPLTISEFRILSVLAEHPGQVFSRLQLLERVFGDIYEGYERTIDTHISNLRKKMEQSVTHEQGVKIRTVYGAGYKLVSEDQ
ncbi:MAG: response regulator transcription factor [Methylocystaceae bacterium]